MPSAVDQETVSWRVLHSSAAYPAGLYKAAALTASAADYKSTLMKWLRDSTGVQQLPGHRLPDFQRFADCGVHRKLFAHARDALQVLLSVDCNHEWRILIRGSTHAPDALSALAARTKQQQQQRRL